MKMKFIIQSTFLIIILSAFQSFHAQTLLDDLQIKKEVLKQNTKLIDLQIDLEKEKLNNLDLVNQVEQYKSEVAVSSNKYSGSDNPKETEKHAKKTDKVLKAAQKANDRLISSNRKIEDYELEIKRLQEKINQMKQVIHFLTMEEERELNMQN